MDEIDTKVGLFASPKIVVSLEVKYNLVLSSLLLKRGL